MQRLLDAMTMAPVYVRNGRMDMLAANRLGRAVFAPLFGSPAKPDEPGPVHFPRPGRAGVLPGWDRLASDTVALLRAEAGRNPTDRALSDLIGELSTRSEIFRIRWADHNVRQHRAGVKHFHHPVVGDISLAYESLELVADTGLVLNGYSAEPGIALPGRAEPARQLGGHRRSRSRSRTDQEEQARQARR